MPSKLHCVVLRIDKTMQSKWQRRWSKKNIDDVKATSFRFIPLFFNRFQLNAHYCLLFITNEICYTFHYKLIITKKKLLCNVT